MNNEGEQDDIPSEPLISKIPELHYPKLPSKRIARRNRRIEKKNNYSPLCYGCLFCVLVMLFVFILYFSSYFEIDRFNIEIFPSQYTR